MVICFKSEECREEGGFCKDRKDTGVVDVERGQSVGRCPRGEIV